MSNATSTNSKTICFVGYAGHKKVRWHGKLVSPNLDSDILAHAGSSYDVYCLGDPVSDELIPSTYISLSPRFLDVVKGFCFAGPLRLRDFRYLLKLYRQNEFISIHGINRKWLKPFWSVWAVRNMIISRAFAYKLRAIAAHHDQARLIVSYSAAMLGVIYAFRKANKPVHEIQHGYIGPSHNAYNKRDVISSDSFFAPSGFVVWDERAATFLKALGARDIEVVGYRHLANFTNPAGAARERVILVTTQWLTPLPEFLGVLVEHFSEIIWRFRLHPQEFEPRADIQTFLARGNVELSRPDATLGDDLSESLLHLTEHSSAVHEAASMQVPSLFCDPIGKERFAGEVADGLAVFLDPGNAITTLEALLARRCRKEP